MAEIIDTFEHYRREFPHYLEIIETLQSIHLLREKSSSAKQEECFSLKRADAIQKLKNGQSLIDLQKDLLNNQEPEQYFLTLLSITEKDHPEATAELRKTITADENAYRDLITELFTEEINPSQNNKQRILNIDENADNLDLIPLLLHESLKPVFSQLTENLKDVIANSGWSQGTCPVCARPADLSLIREEEGKRSLFCLQCDCEWPYKRMQCPACGEEDQQKLSYFTLGDTDDKDTRYRVNICRQCKSHIKNIDTRKGQTEINPEIENLVTLHLDLQAVKEGFK